MGRCGGTNTCACAVQAGDGIDVTGEGTAAAPYTIAAEDRAATALGVSDTDTVTLALTGTGTAGDPYEITGDVPDGAVTPAAAPTLDLVGAKAGDGLRYDTGTRVTSVAISADAGNTLALGGDAGLFVGGSAAVIDAGDLISADAGNVLVAGGDALLYVPTPPAGGGGGVTDVWHKATVTQVSPLRVNVSGMPSPPYAAQLAPWLTLLPPGPTVGDVCYVLHPGPGTGIDSSTFLVVGFEKPRPAWARAGIVDLAGEVGGTVTIEINGAPSGQQQQAHHLPSFTPVLDDTVIVIPPGGDSSGETPSYFIIGSAY